jgi:hypothetical protein
LIPVRDEKFVLQIQESLELCNFVQQWQARAALDDQERREPSTGRAETDSLAGAVDLQRDGFVDGE